MKTEREKALEAVVIEMLDRWWPFVHAPTTFASNTARALANKARDALDMVVGGEGGADDD